MGDGEADGDNVVVVGGDAATADLAAVVDIDGPGPASAGCGITTAGCSGAEEMLMRRAAAAESAFTGLENEGPSMTVSLDE